MNHKHAITLILLTAALIGCVTASAERRALQSIGTVALTTDAAIGAYDTWLQTHPGTHRGDIVRARRAVQAYTNSLAVARTAVISYKSGTADKAALDKALDALAASSTNVVQLVGAIQQATGTVVTPTRTPNR